MANRTIDAFIAHLEVVRLEAIGCQSTTHIIGVETWDKARLSALLDAGKHLLEVPISDTPETHPEPPAAA